jgi:folate-binding protein YgfZ
MISDLRVLVREDACWLDVPSIARDRVLERLETFIISEDVEVRDLTGSTARLGIYGPASAETVAAIAAPGSPGLAATLSSLPEHAHVTVPVAQGELLIAANADLGVTGYDVYAAADARDALLGALEVQGVVPLDAATWETCRIEAGRPLYGTDMDQETIPLEAGLEQRAISFTKGCYVGQEVIVRVRDRGQGRVARRLMGILADTGPDGSVPELTAGDPVFADREVGRVTSAAFSPALGRVIALAYLHRDHAAEGVRLSVHRSDGDVAVSVVQVPFIDKATGTRPVPAS